MKFGTGCCKKQSLMKVKGFLDNGTETGRVREVQLQTSRMSGLPCTLCKDHTFKRTSSELQNLSHTNELMGNDRDTIFAMVCTPSSTRGLIL